MQGTLECTEINLSDMCLRAVFQKLMLDVPHQLPPPGSTQNNAELDMEWLTQFTVQLVKQITDKFQPSSRRSTSFNDEYSQEFILRKWHLCLIVFLK